MSPARVARALLAWLLLAPLAGLAAEPDPQRWSPEQARQRLARDGRLAHGVITGAVDLARWAARPGGTALELLDVQIDGPLTASAPVRAGLRCEQCRLTEIRLAGAQLDAAVEINDSQVRGLARFDGARFRGPLLLAGTAFDGGASFRGAQFEQPVAVLHSRFAAPAGLTGGVSLADARFQAGARFDDSEFVNGVRFDSALFQADVSMLKLRAGGVASFRNTQFMRDAEFRFCQLARADFGDAQQMSAFHGLADFRGCRVREVRFDYAEFRGPLSLVALQVEQDLSLRQANLRAGADFSGLAVGAALRLDGAHFQSLRWRWAELGAAVLRAPPTADVLATLRRHVDERADAGGARALSRLVAAQQFRDAWHSDTLPFTERAWAAGEWLLWGWPTGWGTQPGRVLLLAAAAWLLLTAPLLLRRGLIVCLPQGWQPDASGAIHQPLAPALLAGAWSATTWRGRLLAWLRFGAGLMFKWPGVRERAAPTQAAALSTYLLALWWLGALLLALLALTAANVSPVLQALVGKLV